MGKINVEIIGMGYNNFIESLDDGIIPSGSTVIVEEKEYLLKHYQLREFSEDGGTIGPVKRPSELLYRRKWTARFPKTLGN